MQRQDLERMTREQLIAQAERLGIPRPRVLTAPELIDEIINRTTTNERDRVKARGWLGRARDLLAKVVEKGLHLPEAARVLRQDEKRWPAPPPPLPTVTLAEIYAAQGHFERAIATLDEVLGREPDHREARTLRERFVEQLQRARARAGRVELPPPPPVKPAKPAKRAPSMPPTETAPAETTPAETAPAETAPAETAPAETAPAETAPAETAPAETAPAEAAPKEPTGEEVASTQPAGRLAEEAVEATPAAVAPHEAAAEEAVEEESPAGVQAAEGEEREDATPTEEEAPPTDRTVASGTEEEEPPLPQRYEVDEIVAVAVDPRTIYLYWEVRATTLAHARAVRPDGALCVRIASVTASWDGPQVDTRDMPVDALYGDRFVREIQPGSNVRVSLGWKSSAGFEPLAVAVEVTAPRAVPVGAIAEEVGRWEEQTPIAPFQDWRPDLVPPEPPPAEVRAFQPFVPHQHTHAARGPAAPVPSSAAPAPYAGPIDTGVADWDAPPADAEAIPPRVEIERREETTIEPAWFVRGGASELSRGGPGRVMVRTVEIRRLVPGRPGAPRLGGASELTRGGASELTR